MGDMTGIFRDIQNNRREATQAMHQWGVFPLTARGTVAKQPSWTGTTEAAAQAQATRMTALNPGKTYVVQAL